MTTMLPQLYYNAPAPSISVNNNSTSSSSSASQSEQTDETTELISVPTQPIQEFVYSDTPEYYRDYSFVDRLSIIDPHVEGSPEKNKENVLQHRNNSSRQTKNQIYKQIASGKWRYNKIYGVESSATNKTNPNVHNLIRVDKDKNVINEKYVDVIPDITSSLPRTLQMTSVDNIIHYDTFLKTNSYPQPDKTTIYFPLVANRIYAEEPPIVEGGILYSGTTFDPTVDRELQVIKDYKIRERVIIEESLAELFSVNAAETYTEQEVLDAYNKSMKDVYSYMSSWEKNHIMTTHNIYFNPLYSQYSEATSQGPHLSSTYIAGEYTYSESDKKYTGYMLNVITLIGNKSV